jgi:hypothetical protein
MKSLLALLVLLPILARAELPPSAYEKMQAAAPEYFKIEVLRVDVAPGESPTEQTVHVVALVTSAIRTQTGIKADDIINIYYTVKEQPKGWVGPGAVPVLQDREQCVAYLKRLENGDFQPAAGRMSFSNF